MPTFEAKTKAERDGKAVGEPKPGETTVPEADIAGWEYSGFGWFYMYTHDQHSERDLLRPGYFDPIVGSDRQRYFGALFLYTARCGAKDPEDWQTGLARIGRVKGQRGYEAQQPTKVVIVKRFGKGTLAAHGGEPVDEKAA